MDISQFVHLCPQFSMSGVSFLTSKLCEAPRVCFCHNTTVHCCCMLTVDLRVLLLLDFTTVLPQTYVTEEDLTEPTSSLTTSLTTGLSTTDTNVTWTMSSGTSVTDDNPNLSNVTITHGEHATSGTNYTHQSVTSSPATHTDPDHLLNSTTLSYSSTVFRSTQEGDRTKNESTPQTANPEDIISVRPQESGTLGNITQKYEIPGTNSTLRTGSGVVAKGNNYLIFHR